MYFMKGNIRYYQRNNKLYPSVTSILSNSLISIYLANWQLDISAQFVIENIKQISEMEPVLAKELIIAASTKIKNKAGNRGTKLHEWICSKDDKYITEEIAGYCEQYKKWVEKYEVDTRESEIVCYTDKPFAYAGTIDAICIIDGKKWIIDFKTSRRIYNHTWLQLIAYGNTTRLIRNNEDIKMDFQNINYGIVHLQKDNYRFLKFNKFKEKQYFRVFRAYYTLFAFNQVYKQSFKKVGGKI